MSKSHAAVWGSDAPTPAQLKEFFAQVEAGRVTRERLQAFLGLSPLILPPLTIGVPCRELTPSFNGWELAENATSPVGTLTLQLAEFLEDGEESVVDEVMRARAGKHGFVLGEIHARALFEVQDKIPKEWRPFYLAFPGTIWRGPSGNRNVPCLNWGGGRWALRWYWLGSVWDSSVRIVALRAPARLNDNSRSGG